MTCCLKHTLSRGMILAATGWLVAACSAADMAPTAPPGATAFIQPNSTQLANASLGAPMRRS